MIILCKNFLTLVIGTVLVFFILSVLSLVYSFCKNLFKRAGKKVDVKHMDPAKDDFEKDEILAVLMAAVSAYLEPDINMVNLKLFKRVSPIGSMWSEAGLFDVINARFYD